MDNSVPIICNSSHSFFIQDEVVTDAEADSGTCLVERDVKLATAIKWDHVLVNVIKTQVNVNVSPVSVVSDATNVFQTTTDSQERDVLVSSFMKQDKYFKSN